MSTPREPHRPFFPFGNPFRMISPKSSQLSTRLKSLLNAFEETLAERFRKLIPKHKDDILSLTWMKLAMVSLCETHTDIKTLITDLELPVTDWDEKWIDVYLDISVKLLDICIALSSEITRLNQGHLLLKCALHNSESDPSKKLVRARSSLDSWSKHVSSTNPRLQNCGPLLNGLVETLDLPKVKNSAKGKVLMSAMYGVKVQTVFVCSAFATAFSGSLKNLLELTIPNTILWAQTYSVLQTCVNGEIRNIFSHGKFTVLKELEAVDLIAKKLFPMIPDGVETSEEEAIQNSFTDLEQEAEMFSQRLDALAKEVDGFFKIVLTGRDALLCNLRMSDTFSDPMSGSNVDQQMFQFTFNAGDDVCQALYSCRKHWMFVSFATFAFAETNLELLAWSTKSRTSSFVFLLFLLRGGFVLKHLISLISAYNANILGISSLSKSRL